MGYRVAVVGATGNVGREMLNILEELKFPVDKMHADRLAQIHRRRGLVRRQDPQVRGPRAVRLLHRRHRADERRRRPSPRNGREKIGAAGPIVIDNSSAFRMDPDVPLIVPEVNPDAIELASQEEHHRQPQLLDRPAGGGAEAAARRGEDQARGGLDLPVGLRRRQGGHGRAVEPDQGRLRASAPPSPSCSPSRSPSTSSPSSATSTTTATPTRKPRCGTRPTRSSIPPSS